MVAGNSYIIEHRNVALDIMRRANTYLIIHEVQSRESLKLGGSQQEFLIGQWLLMAAY